MAKRRPRAERCRRLGLKDIAHLVVAGASSASLPDGTTLRLRWGSARGCFGGRPGRSLLMVCPCCQRSARVLWRPPAQSWGCCRCRPVSHRSHRRSGAQAGDSKPSTWRAAQLMDQQRRCAALLGLAQWPPNKLLWDWRDLQQADRRPGAPRLSRRRALALTRRLEALEWLRFCAAASQMNRFMAGLNLPPALAHADAEVLCRDAEVLLRITSWAVRRPPQDPRTNRRAVRSCSSLDRPPGAGKAERGEQAQPT